MIRLRQPGAMTWINRGGRRLSGVRVQCPASRGAMRGIVKAFRHPPAVRPRDRDGGFASPRHALLAENLGKPAYGSISALLGMRPTAIRRGLFK